MSDHNYDVLAELAKALPEEFAVKANELVEKMGQKIEGVGDGTIEWRVPYMRVVQGTSDRSKLPRGSGIGDIIVGEVNLGKELSVIPIRSYVSRQMWSPDQNETRILCSSPDAKVGFRYGNCNACNFGKFDTERNKSDCNKMVTVIGISADLSTMFITNFSKTNYAHGNDWMGLMRKANVAPYKRTYTLHTETSKKSKNVEALLAENGTAVAPELIPFLEELFKKVTEHREDTLTAHYEAIKNRVANAQIPGPSSAPALTDDSQGESQEATEVIDQTTSEETPAKGKGGKVYSL